MTPKETITNRFGTYEAMEPHHGCNGCVAILPDQVQNTHYAMLCELLPCISRGEQIVIFKEVKPKSTNEIQNK